MTREERIQHIKDHPDEHKHTAGELTACCMVDGALDLSMMDVHGNYVDLGSNGGTNCDVVDGPCACGAWHHRGNIKIDQVRDAAAALRAAATKKGKN